MKRPVILFATILLGCGWISGCQRRAPAPPPAHARYTLGPAWQSGGYWFYPAEESSYTATGLAVVDPPELEARRITADGEAYDPALVAAAHQTLQLPVMLRVRNLENGREITLRVNDRGPGAAGRLLSVTPRAALLLGMVPGQATRVRLTEDEPRSRGLLQQVDGAPPPDVIAAPVGAVQEQSLMPAGFAPQSYARASTQPDSTGPALPEPARESVTVYPADPGQLWIDAGHFSEPGYARRLAAQLSGMVRQDGRGRSSVFSVRVGPFNLPTEADAALDQARSAGVTGARIIVE